MEGNMIAINVEFAEYDLYYDGMEKAVKRAKECGVTHVHWVYDWEDEYMYSKHEMEYIKVLLDKYALKAKSLHATEGGVRGTFVNGKKFFDNRNRLKRIRKDYTSKNEYMRKAGVELVVNRLELAKLIGAEDIVLHMQYPYELLEDNKLEKDAYWEQVFKSFDELEKWCISNGMKIAVENMICTPKEYQFEQFDKLFARYSFDFLGFTFDSGHGALMCEDTIEFAKRYQDRLIAVHLHDNQGPDLSKSDDPDTAILASDSHAIPFTGVMDWEGLTEVIAKSPYELPLNLELVMSGEVTEEKQRDFIKSAVEAGNKLTKMVLEKRK